MKKVAIYARFGKKEQLELTEQEQQAIMEQMSKGLQGSLTPNKKPIPSPAELEAEGYEVITLPKEKQSECAEDEEIIPKM